MEKDEPATAHGPGVRTCSECGERWRSYLGELTDSGELAALRTRGECRVYASWDRTLGLTCRGCRRSRCRAHWGEPRTAAAVPGADDYVCPHCGDRLDHG
ncbi:hypothetical protein DVA86_15580 [Streptomyces armeniacus]|uniref:Uncharacterized protein n=1 Tax=Streptomyces armeniacus TaxID=83291 RepID=A0A345XQF5_9ACTN|nr:hypothetical protein [Streptomyces armeniacus]AXK33871.1 hypothetical protein DVA86_15580 [Streptomyces armeniacus]